MTSSSPPANSQPVPSGDLKFAADLLRREDMTIGAIAERVGYGSPYALSTAFKRERGVSPSQHRELVAAGV